MSEHTAWLTAAQLTIDGRPATWERAAWCEATTREDD